MNKAPAISNRSGGKLSLILPKLILSVTAICFLWAAASVFIRNYYRYNGLLLAASVFAALALIILFWLAAGRHEAFLTKNSKWITLGFLLFMGACQAALIFPLRYTPVFDVDAIFGGAAEWAETGDFASYHQYFGMFHNNFGGLLLLRAVFGAAKLIGITDHYLVASVFNSALSLLTMYLTGAVAAEFAGVRGRVTAYFLFVISLPFYFIAPAFYTDALSMVFPVLILRLYLIGCRKKRFLEQLAAFLLMGLAAGMGFCIKGTVAIMLVAVMLETVLRWDLKRLAALALASAVAVPACIFFTRGMIYRHLDRSEAEKAEIPVLHWVMMGTVGNGFYNPDEYEFTKSFEDPAERKKAVAERLSERLKDYSAKDFLKLFTTKLDIDFGDGTYGLSDCLGGTHGENNFLHSFLLNDGEHRDAYKHICTGVVIALYLLLIASCIAGVFGNELKPGTLASRAALLSLLLFLLAWEARWRYFSNYIPVFMISAVIGLDSIIRRRKKARK